MDIIEFELLEWRPRTVWKCRQCGRYRHRDELKGLFPAKCCDEGMILIDRYKQPVAESCVATFEAE
jgi:hypothetical protein